MSLTNAARRSALLLVAALTVLGCRLETAGAPMGSDHFETHFDDVQELAIGHTVRMSDVVVGTVVGIELDGYQAVVRYSIVDDRSIPEGTAAAIASTSLLGENYVQLQLPAAPSAGVLPAESEIPSAGTTASIEELAVQLLTLTRAIQGRDLAAVVEAGATAIGPRGPQLNELLGSVGDLASGLASQSDDLDRLLTSAETLLAALAPNSRAIGATLDAAASATATLAQQRVRIVDTVDSLTALAVTLDAEVLDPHLDRLAGIIADLAPVTSELVTERARLSVILERLVVVAERVPSAIHEGGALAYAWQHNYIIGGELIDAAPASTTSFFDLLLPKAVRRS